MDRVCGSRLPLPCVESCKLQLACGHICTGYCRGCSVSGHKPCKLTCTKILQCQHTCRSKHACGAPCPPCSRVCKRAFPYSSCVRRSKCFLRSALSLFFFCNSGTSRRNSHVTGIVNTRNALKDAVSHANESRASWHVPTCSPAGTSAWVCVFLSVSVFKTNFLTGLCGEICPSLCRICKKLELVLNDSLKPIQVSMSEPEDIFLELPV